MNRAKYDEWMAKEGCKGLRNIFMCRVEAHEQVGEFRIGCTHKKKKKGSRCVSWEFQMSKRTPKSGSKQKTEWESALFG